MVEELRIPVSGGEMAVRDYGGPGRTVVLVHSAGYSSHVWSRFAPLLARSARVLTVDLRGHGQSSAQVGSVADIVVDFERLVAELDLRCPVIVGHQFGGGMATVVAATYPLLWGGLCLIDSPAMCTQVEYAEMLEIFHTPEVIDTLVERFALGAFGHGEESLQRFLSVEGERLARDWLSLPAIGFEAYSVKRSILRDEGGGWVRQPTRECVERLTDLPAHHPLTPGRELFEKIPAPVWVLQPELGEYGQGFEETAALAKGRLGWAASRIPGGTFVAHTNPQVVLDALLALLATLPRQQEADRAAADRYRAPSLDK